MKDSLGDFLKTIEREQNGETSSPENYLYMRIDGRSFSKLTSKMKRPFDMDFHFKMNELSLSLMEEFRPDVVMKQSDEISLLWKPVAPPSEIIFTGKKHKLLSLVPSYASSFLSLALEKVATFDARMIETDKETSLKLLWWRYKDCTKNAISQTASHFFSEKFLSNKSTNERFELIKDEGVWQNLPSDVTQGYWLFKDQTEEKSVIRKIKIESRIEYYSEFAIQFEKFL